MAERTRSYEFSRQAESVGGVTTVYEDASGGTHTITVDPSSSAPLTITKTFQQRSPICPIDVGDKFRITRGELGKVIKGPDYAMPTTTFTCTSYRVVDDVVDLEDGRKRVWSVTITGVDKSAESADGSSSLRARTHELSKQSEASGGWTAAYEDTSGAVHQITIDPHTSAPRTVTKTFWQESPISPIDVGDTFSVGLGLGGSFICTSYRVSDEILDLKGEYKRLWKISVTGRDATAEGASDGQALRKSVTVTQSLNGTVERSIAGTMVVLQASTTPKATLDLTAYSSSQTPPVSVGGSISEGGISFYVTSVSTSRNVIEKNGQLIAVVWQHTITGEA